MEQNITGGMILAIHEAREACRGEPDLTERIRKAMKPCRDHWMETNPDNQFRSAIAAAILESEGAERDRIERSAASLRRLSAMLSALQAGVPVDVEAMPQPDDDTLPLTSLWNECRR